MKKLNILFVMLALFLGMSLGAQPMDKLSAEESNHLKFLFEEDKLARDVYATLDEKWDLQIFKNIQNAERHHMDLLQALAEKYKVKLPKSTLNNKTGVFENKALQKLFDNLIQSGLASKINALIVGAKVEEIDIQDLTKKMNATTNSDLIDTYQTLINASHNHLRAFVKNIEKNQESYSPIILDLENYQKIISGTNACAEDGDSGSENCKGSKKKGKGACCQAKT